MTLVDIDSGRTYSLMDLYDEWLDLRAEEPWNHADNFRSELFEILMATINGRNDMDVVGLTPREVTNYIINIKHRLNY